MEINQENTDYPIYIASLIYRNHQHEPLTNREQADLQAWSEASALHRQLFEQLQDRKAVTSRLKEMEGYDTDDAMEKIFGQLGIALPAKAAPVRIWRRWMSVAAIFIVLLGGSLLYLVMQKTPTTIAVVPQGKKDIPPGVNKATLVLADGSTVVLDSAHNGELARQGNTSVTGHNGQVAYNSPDKSGPVIYNIMTTPRGGQYQLVLQDGTKVWLNAASSIRYPVSFTGHERVVEVTGEAYFEVAHNAAMPFKVKAGGQLIEDIGTGFNINAYPDEEAVKTTLIEGSVKLTYGSSSVVIRPGQQGATAAGHAKIRVLPADIEATIAWKEGMFKFNGAGIETIMRQVARWYNVDIVYEGPIPVRHYHGGASRSMNAADMLKVLEQSGIKFNIEGQKIIVMKN